MDSSKECFLLDEAPRTGAFLSFKMKYGPNRRTSYYDIFKCFFTDDLMDHLYIKFESADLLLRSRRNMNKEGEIISFTPSTFILKLKYMWQALAIQIRIIGNQGNGKNLLWNLLPTLGLIYA